MMEGGIDTDSHLCGTIFDCTIWKQSSRYLQKTQKRSLYPNGQRYHQNADVKV
jgi:hypothetical protein